MAQHATSVSASLIKIRVDKLHPCFGSRGSEVRVLSPRPFKTMGYALGRSPFLLLGSISGSIFSEFSAKILQVSPGKSRFNNLVILVLFSFVLK